MRINGPLTALDRREFRNFERFLKLREKHLARMMTRQRWQKYLGLNPAEAWRYAGMVKKGLLP